MTPAMPSPAAKKAKLDGNDVAEGQPESEKKPLPPYGSQEYWEKRYKKQRRLQLAAMDGGDVDDMASDDDGDIDPFPHHAWYFTYDELRPLILPVILGGRDKAVEILSGRNEEENGDESSHDEDEEDESECATRNEGLAHSGPISILEIGCGDMPLGKGLSLDFSLMSQATGGDSRTVVERIVCCDYSDSVITTMKEQQRDTTLDGSSNSVTYVVADARELPYADSSFQFIIEKGTLDAMLSDKQAGITHCQRIISECARVLADSGCIMIVSHVNAHTPNGVDWLEKVVIPALRTGGGSARWVIEVHGNDGVSEWDMDVANAEEESGMTHPEHEDTDEDGERDCGATCEERNSSLPPSGSPGPAVYMIHMSAGPVDTGPESGGKLDDQPQPIPLKFYSY